MAEYFGEVRWTEEDVREALERCGVQPTDENVSRVVGFCESHHFTDRLIELGWDVMSQYIEDNICEGGESHDAL